MEFTSYPFGFWNYLGIDEVPLSDVDSWAKAGMTCTQTPGFSYGRNDPSKLTALLDKMNECGIKAFLCIEGLSYNTYKHSPEKFKEVFAKAYADFGHHPAAVGFFLGDEPSGEKAVAACKEALNYVKDNAPELKSFLNFLPYWDGIEDTVLGGVPFDEWVDKFIQESNCPIICYDCYAQMNPEKEGWDMYFKNLNKFNAAAKRNNVLLWNTALSVGHFRYRIPTEDDFRWQINTSAAAGCNGMLWFYWYGQFNWNSYRGTPIDDLGEESETYIHLRRQQYIFQKRFGKLFTQELHHEQTYMYGEVYGGYPEYKPYDIAHLAKCDSRCGEPGMVSKFTDKEGREYIVLVNNSPFKPDMQNLYVDKGIKYMWRYGLNDKPYDFIDEHWDNEYGPDDNDCFRAGVWLAPGQMAIFRLEY